MTAAAVAAAVASAPGTTDPKTAEPAGPPPGLRLLWAAPGASDRFDAAWWPRTTDAPPEVAGLLPEVAAHCGRPVGRIALNIGAWGPAQPRRLSLSGRRLRVGWFHTIDPQTASLRLSDGDHVVLLVIPSDTGAADGEAALSRLAAAPSWPDTPAAALERTAAPHFSGGRHGG